MISIVLLLMFSQVTNQLLMSKRVISVPIGREVFIQTDDLSFSPGTKSTICKVEVIRDEPMTQRVGTIFPQVFDCAFDSKTVKYVHHGSPLVWNDTVKFRVTEFSSHDTISEYFELFFTIQNNSYNVILPLRSLVVKEFFGLTDAIDESVLNFNYSRNEGATCKIKMSRHFDLRPSHGQIVIGQENQAVDVIKRRCDEFLQLGLRYEHLKPPSPNIDFISITVEVNNPLLNDIITEWYHIPVIIEPGFPNLPPKASFSGMYLMDVDQFIITALTPTVLSATDSETPSSLLVFNISKPLLPHQGSIVHLSADHSRAVSSFKQSDLNNFDIAYKPPARSFEERQMFEIGFVISDSDFTLSDPFTMHIAVRPAITSAPRVFMNAGLILLEGQSRPLRKVNLEVVDGDNIEEVKIFVTGGLHHGWLEVRGRTAYSFSQDDISSESVVYHHDDSDSVRDSIHLRISDGIQSSHLKFPIVIIPKDDSHPSLIINTGLKIKGKKNEVQILSTLLRGSDHDSLDDNIKFNVTKPPMFGEIWKKFAWEDNGNEVSVFSQQDINKGLIYYHLNLKPVTAAGDSFEIVLQDTNHPPNISPPYTVSVQVAGAAFHNDSPPKQDPAASFHLEVREDGDVALFSSDNLHYMDDVDEEIIFTVTTSPRFIGSFAHADPGKIVNLLDAVEDEYIHLPAITSFTQLQVNHRKVGYIPPKGEIGPNPLFLQFIFSITDSHHNTLKGQTFNITVLPVNNQAPQLRTSELLVEEGSSTLVSTNEFSVYDPDTFSSDLQISLFTVPLHGTLRRSDQLLRVGDLLSLDDILTLRIEYIHDGSEDFRDGFKVGVNDGLHFVSGDVLVTVEPVDDEKPLFTVRDPRISVNEGGSLILTSQVLSASDVDTKSDSLNFILTEMPLLGSIHLNASKVHRFTQRSLLQGEVSFVHGSQEVGPNPKEDSFTLIVTDKMFPSPGPHDSIKVLVTILPVNSQPPRVLFKRTLLVEEGQQIPITEENIFASDDDTFLSELLVMIVKQPHHGYLQNTRPATGYESAIENERVSAFPLQDVSNGFISFVQLNHSGMEPESDDFEICITDGVHNSSSVLVYVSIILVNDEVPHFYLSNVTVKENDHYVFDNESVIASDGDYPGDILLLSVKEEPKHGSLTYFLRAINNGPMLEIPFNQMAFENFDKIVYRHDGSETAEDSFTLSLNDGLHSVHRTCSVTILPVNDEPPRLKLNLGVQKMDILSHFSLTPSVLLAEDADTPSNQILYKITKPPAHGLMEILNATTWEPVRDFLQEDINLNRIRYRHTNSSAYRDNFTFFLTDGELNSTSEVFEVKLIDSGTKSVVNVVIEQGGQTLLNSSVIYASGNASEEIIIFVTKMPLHGDLLVNNDTQIRNFSALHPIKDQLSYKHDGTLGGDTFSVSNKAMDYTFNIIVTPSTILNHSLPLSVSQPSLITSDHLLSSGPSPSQIMYFIREFPKMGRLMYAENVSNPKSFTQEDIDGGLVSFWPDAGTRGSDHFHFQVSADGIPTENVYRFEIFVLTDPIVHVKNLSHLKSVWREEMGFEVTSSHLRVSGYPPHLIHFHISKNLEHCHLFHLQKEMDVKTFTQEDVIEGRLVILLSKNGSTRDYFLFHIYINGTNMTGLEYSLHLEWSVVHFVYSEYWVCEDEGTLRVDVRRIGRSDESALVTIIAEELTARESLDFVTNRNTIQFDPGEEESAWKIVIVKDDEREESIERLRLTLSQPNNCLILDPNSTLINICDLNTNSCSRMPSKKRKEFHNKEQQEDRLSPVVDEVLSDNIPGTTVPPQPHECPKDWQKFGSKCYKWYRPAALWANAQSICEEQPAGSLVTVDSQDHNNWLVQLARNRPFWIGYQPSPENESFTNWKKGSSGGKHRCVLVRGSGVWINKNCEASQSFICEIAT